MARYSFYVHKKDIDLNLYTRKRYPLPFLDYFATQFNNREELIKFLGCELDQYDDIGVVYKSEGTVKNLQLYYDSLELEKIAGSLIRLPFSHTGLLVKERLALGYKFPKMVRCETQVPDSDQAKEITRRIYMIPGFADMAHELEYIDDHTYEYYKKGDHDHLHRHLLKSYLSLRKVYALLRSEYYLIGNPEIVKPEVDFTMQGVIQNYSEVFDERMQVLLRGLLLTPEEEQLVARILFDLDEASYDLLMASPSERLNYLKPLITEINKRRGNALKKGSIS